MQNKIITESSTKILASTGTISKHLPVFYNPVMKFNRDISIALLNALNRKGMQIADPLAGSGIRSIRFLKELNKGIIKEIDINDYSTAPTIKKNLKLNKVKARVTGKDATRFLLESSGYDYIDIDPFGSPNPFLDAAVKRVSRGGIIAVTATDTAPLCGTYINACKRKYWTVPLRNELMHEVGLRILIRKVQLIGTQYDKALIPILSYAKDHYFRIFFKTKKSKDECDELIKKHHEIAYCPKCTNQEIKKFNACTLCKTRIITAGPLWTGPLADKQLLQKVAGIDHETAQFLDMLRQESQMLGFHDLHKLARITKKLLPKTETVLRNLKQNGYIATQTHFSPYGIKTNAPLKEIIRLFGEHQ